MVGFKKFKFAFLILLFLLLETFVGEKFDKKLLSTSCQTEICSSCLRTIEEYDELCLKAARIQEDIANIFNINQQKYREESEDLLKCKICFAQCSSYDEFNGHDCIIDNEDGYEVLDYADESNEETEVSNSPKKRQEKVMKFNYTCNTCDEHFERKRDYQVHSKLAHLPEGATLFTCSECDGHFFVSEMELQLHNVLYHPENPSSSIFSCPICCKSFNTKALLSRHFGIHSSSSDRPHVCEK